MTNPTCPLKQTLRLVCVAPSATAPPLPLSLEVILLEKDNHSALLDLPWGAIN